MKKKKDTPGNAEGPRARSKAPRTPSGKRFNVETQASAEQESRAWLKERTEEGHLMAGRTPPSQKSDARQAGATRVIDDAIRDYTEPMTEDEKLLQTPSPGDSFTKTDPWRVMRITADLQTRVRACGGALAHSASSAGVRP